MRTTVIFLFTFFLIVNCFCQSNSKKEDSIQNENKYFGEESKFDTLLNNFAKLTGFVNDYDDLYTREQVSEMDSIINDFEKVSSIRLVVITFDSITVKYSEIDDVTKAIVNRWEIGGDSGKVIVIGISKPYKRMRIQNGKYIQSFFSDSETKEIINSFFIPEFRNDHYFEGTLLGLKALIKALPAALAEKTKVEF